MGSRNLYRAFVIILCLIITLLCMACAHDIPDAQLIKTAKQTPEVKLFLKIYPEAKPIIDRSGGLGVSFRVDETTPLNPHDNYDWKYIRLSVPIDPSTLKVEADKMFIDDYRQGRITYIKQP